MSGQWQLNLTSFGKLKSASIRAQKLTLLVGKNNTGKSYAATALWSLDSLRSLFVKADLRTRRLTWLKRFFDQVMTGDDAAVLEVNERRQAELVSLLNKILERYGQEFYSEIFAVDAENFSGSNVKVEKFRSSGMVTVSYAVEETEIIGRRPRFRYKTFTLTDASGYSELFQISSRVTSTFREPSDYLAQAILSFMLGLGIGGSLYIPAARNGLMLALPALGAYSLEGLSGDQESAILPRTTRRFLQELDWGLRYGDQEAHDVADWLESSVLDGTVETIKDVESPRFAYRPAGRNLQIPMHATSSMIAELAPVLICLRQNKFAKQVIFEEPEAHLHLSAQRIMARAIGRLINQGISVTVVTHSDTFVQQLNNLMALYRTAEGDERRKNYLTVDLIDPDAAVAYEFIGEPDGTVARELQRDEGGFIVPSLNETLINLADETVGLQGT